MSRQTHGMCCMSVSVRTNRDERGYLIAEKCATCGDALGEPFAWCSTCRAALCTTCGRDHFCTPSCPQNGCLKGLCARLVTNRELSASWGLPDPCAPTS
jgi:hypothetical protein